MPRPIQRPGRPANRPGQTRGGRAGRLEAFERQAQQTAIATAARAAEAGPVELPPVITVADLANLLALPDTQIIKALIGNGIMATRNQALDFDTAAIVASDLGFETREQGQAPSAAEGSSANGVSAHGAVATAAERLDEEEPVDEASLQPRPPVVTIMGHVDHGKTSLLDAIRQTSVVTGEAGGITQHIGAYQVDVKGQRVTFLDTPGHEAFTAMRARGARATDVAVIVVAADDGVMPQTREAIDHAKAAGVPIVVAINKTDVPNANPDRVKTELTDYGLVVTEYGGTVEAVNVSARTREGIDSLLETIQLVSDAEVNPRANPHQEARGVVVEARLDKARGAVATALVQKGTLHVGDVVIAGTTWGKIKALFDDRGHRVAAAPPSFPVEILGLSGVPSAGDTVRAVKDERAARVLVEASQAAGRGDDADLSAEALFARIRSGTTKELNLIVKADVQGSVEPLVSSLEKLGGDQSESRAKVIHAGLGNVSVTDVNLAVASRAMIVAFNVRTEPDARRAAELNGVSVRDYSVIYTLVEDVEQMLTGMHEPRFAEIVHGHAEVRATFKAGKRTIAGSFVTDGIIHRRDRARLSRRGEQLWDGQIASLKRFKDDAPEVREGFECGIMLEDWDELQEGDILEAFSNERI